MIFERDFQILQILDVLMIDQTDIDTFVHARNMDALSFRLCADTRLLAGRDTYRLTDNALAFVPHGLDYRRISARDKLIAIHFNAVNYVPQGLEVYTPRDPSRLRALFERMLLCWEAREDGYQYDCSSLLYEIFGICHRQFATQRKLSGIEAGVSYLQKNWSDPSLTVSAAARQSHMSEVYFRKLFRREYGTTPRRYIIDLRMQNAVSLMDTGYFSLQEVAEQSGYTDYKYFSVEFKRIKGCSPSAYMRRRTM